MKEGYERYIIFLKELLAGGIAGAVSRTVVSPLERMKILFQVQGSYMTKYNGIWPTLSTIWKEEGWKGYLKGNGTNIVRIIPYSAIQFASYETYKKWCSGLNKPGYEVYLTLVAGAGAGITSVTCTYPLDIIRTRLSLSPELQSFKLAIPSSTYTPLTSMIHRSSIITTGLLIVNKEGGVGSLYRGLLPTLLGIAPYVALNFTVYEFLKRQIQSIRGREPSVQEKLWCGGTAGAIAQTATYPLDVLRRRLQVHGSPTSPFKYSSMTDAIVNMIRNEGPRAFYKGMLPNLLKVVPSVSVSFVTYELCKKLFLSPAKLK